MLLCSVTFLFGVLVNSVISDNYQLEEPTSCEVCKYFVVELQNRLDETGKSKEVLRLGHGLSTKNIKAIAYKTSELRLVEAMDGICDKILEYNMHKERTGSLRFAKGRSETMQTLHGLVDKGVKVELGIPYELWDEPSVEVTLMKKQCERMLEQYEEKIEEWYFHQQDSKSLMNVLCRQTVLNKDNQACLEETWTGIETKYPKEDDEEKEKRKKKKSKRKKQAKGESGDDSDSDNSDVEDNTSSKDEL